MTSGGFPFYSIELFLVSLIDTASDSWGKIYYITINQPHIAHKQIVIELFSS